LEQFVTILETSLPDHPPRKNLGIHSGRVLVLDGHSSAALAFVRALGRAGCTVAVGYQKDQLAEAAHSRYCQARFEYDPPLSGASHFVEVVGEYVERNRIEFVIPTTEATLWPMAKYRERLGPETTVGAPALSAIEATSDKFWVFRNAKAIGFSTPETLLVRSLADLKPTSSWPFPIFIKDRCSVGWVDDHGVPGSVDYASTKEALERKVQARVQRSGEAIVQAYSPGVGIGLSCFMVAGRAHLPFQWQRLREKDPRGSGSSCRISLAPRRDLLQFTEQLLGRANFDGLAMVEFRVDTESSRAVVLEVNSRAWGSMQLPIHCGINYPLYAMNWYLNGEIPPTEIPYPSGITCRWLAADLTHLENVFSGKPPDWPLPYPSRLGTLVKVAIPWYPGLRYDDFSMTDPWPALWGLSKWLGSHFGMIA
jgi:predicted ATP-grasp superfamily ATP-dependent carboligase